MKYLVSVILALSLFGCGNSSVQPDYRQTTVSISNDNGYGSGVVIAPKRVVTNAHVVSEPDLKINDKPIKVLGVDVVNDVAVVEAEVDCPCAPLAKEAPQVGDEIEIVGYPMQHLISKIRVFFKGHYFGELKEPVRSLFGGFAMPGSSGGGIYNSNGELVGLTAGLPTWGAGMMFQMPQLVFSLVAGVTHKSLVDIIKANP